MDHGAPLIPQFRPRLLTFREGIGTGMGAEKREKIPNAISITEEILKNTDAKRGIILNGLLSICFNARLCGSVPIGIRNSIYI